MAAEQRAELIKIDIAARHDAGDFAAPSLAGHGAGHRAGARALGHDAIALGEEPERRGDLLQAGDERAVDQAPRSIEHLGEDRLAADPVDEGRGVIDHPRLASRQGGRKRRAACGFGRI